jgi:hypothetical protein
MMMQWLSEMIAWWEALSRPAAFFFLIPFAVAAMGLLAHALGKRCQ